MRQSKGTAIRRVLLGAFMIVGLAASLRCTMNAPPPGGGDAAAIERGRALFVGLHPLVGGAELSCAACHADNGSGGLGTDIRGNPADHLEEHAQGDGPHSEGTKFPTLTADNFEDMAVFLQDECDKAPECEPFMGDDHGHEDEEE